MTEVSPGILTSLENKRYAISIDNAVSGKLEHLIEKGLKIITLCNDGTGRSARVAKELSEKKIPTVSLEGGLRNIDNNHELYAYLLNEINKVPLVAVILTKDEQNLFSGTLQNLKTYKYTSSNSAIESLSKIDI